MRFTLSWLRDYLETSASLDVICEALTNLGLEVEAVRNPEDVFGKFQIARIIEALPHPNASKLQVCKVDDGEKIIQIVCGAPNARAGLTVCLAPIGTIIPTNNLEIKASQIRGVESFGMMCSSRELGLGEDHEGIMELSSAFTPGSRFVDAMNLKDPLIEIAITPNRGDCLGVMGVARDLAAKAIGTFKPLKLPVHKASLSSPIKVANQYSDDCPLFVGRYFSGVKNTDSPSWLKERLEAIGISPISVLVDITNYLSFDLGRPLHVYDASKLRGNVTVSRAKGGESFVALNHKTYILPEGVITIEDEAGVQALGGIIGGETSGCDENTTDVFLEVALFDPVRVANFGRKLDIITDSRYRFERQVDPDAVISGAEIATQMIVELCGGQASELVISGSVPDWKKTISFEPEFIKKLTGIDVPASTIETVLKSLGFTFLSTGKTMEVLVPSFRSDIEGKVDVVEEVMRIIGYDQLPMVTIPRKLTAPSTAKGNRLKSTFLARHEAANRGLHEVVTWAFADGAKLKLFGPVSEELTIVNPITQDLNHMRTTMYPHHLDAVRRNAHRGYPDLALFETGSIYESAEPGKGQRSVVTGVRSGSAIPKTHHQPARVVDVFDAKADCLAILEALGAPTSAPILQDAPAWYHPGRSGVIRLGKTVLAQFGELHPTLLKTWDIDQTVVGFEIFVDSIPEAKRAGTTKPSLSLSDYQAVTRDFAFIVPVSQKAGEMLRAIAAVDKQLITSVQLFDVYEGKAVENGYKSLAFTVRLQPNTKTLTDEEIEAVSTQIIQAMSKSFQATLRG